MLKSCDAQVGEMQGAAERRIPEAGDPKAGRRCRATQLIACLRKQNSALLAKNYHKRGPYGHSEASLGKISTLFAENQSKDRQAAQFRHFLNERSCL